MVGSASLRERAGMSQRALARSGPRREGRGGYFSAAQSLSTVFT